MPSPAMHVCPIFIILKYNGGAGGNTPGGRSVLKGAPPWRRDCAMPPEAACIKRCSRFALTSKHVANPRHVFH